MAALFATSFAYAGDVNNIVLKANKIGAEIKPTMYGHFFEDINFGADGGLYAELVKNRSFEFPQNFKGWNVFGNVKLMDDGPFERNPHYVRLGNSGHRAYVGGTLAANPLSATAGYVAIREIERTGACELAGKAGDRLTDGLKDLIERYGLPYVAYNQGSIVHLECTGAMSFDFSSFNF